MTLSRASADTVVRRRIRIGGTVQGVGFRPFVYRHAVALGLAGAVRNDAAGVVVEVEGELDLVEELTRRLAHQPPPLARVASIEFDDVAARGDTRGGFAIVASEHDGHVEVAVAVDSATCPACLAEVDDPADRRHGYPFTNCTDCGPRYTIVRAVPYDRPSTTMAGFAMCRACRAEYDDPGDRRFHAQPNACPACGPALAWREPGGAVLVTGGDALDAGVQALREGGIVAVKGLGGYHLAVDATDDEAVVRLRRRKARDDKPFAVMVADLAAARRLGRLDAVAEDALASPRRPIVLVPRRPASGGAGVADAVAEAVAPGRDELGLFLPYTPLHHLLVAGVGRPLVLTSGNVSDEPIAHDDDDAVQRLGPLADGLLTHDRPIHVRCDDSVVRARGGRSQVLRRSRGYTPEPIDLPVDCPRDVLAVGAELKSTIAVGRGGIVVPSHHLGDLEHLATWRAFLQAVEHLPALLGADIATVAHDLHPEYLSTKYALDLGLPTVGVQHHHAHVAACLVDHGRADRVLGLAFDGTGYGTDGTLWGGEFLVADLARFERVAHLAPVPMPGGAAAIRHPWRMATAWAHAAGRRLATVDGVDDDQRRAVEALVEQGAGPPTSGMGRLFDAVAVLLGCRPSVTYEAQAAIELETLASRVPRSSAPALGVEVPVHRSASGGPAVLDPSPLVACLVDQATAGADRAVLAARFHETIGDAAATLAADLAAAAGVGTVALTGGVFQNVRFADVVESHLRAAGLEVLVHREIPPNDGGISIGQAAIAAARR